MSCGSTCRRRAPSPPTSGLPGDAPLPLYAGGGLAVALTALLFLAVPFAFKGTYFLDTRFVIMLGFLLFGALLPCGPAATCRHRPHDAVRRPHGRCSWCAGTYRGDLAALRTVIAMVRPGDRVFIAAVSPDEAPFYWQNGPLSRRFPSDCGSTVTCRRCC